MLVDATYGQHRCYNGSIAFDDVSKEFVDMVGGHLGRLHRHVDPERRPPVEALRLAVIAGKRMHALYASFVQPDVRFTGQIRIDLIPYSLDDAVFQGTLTALISQWTCKGLEQQC